MKNKVFIALLALASTTAYAQKGVEDGSRFGHGQDSINCLNNISLYSESLKIKNYEDAFKNWQKVFTEAPVAQHGTYTNGATILKNLIAKTKDMAQRKKYADMLMSVYDQQLQYLDKLNMLRRSPWTPFYVKGQKAHDYITFYPKMDINKAYQMLDEVIQEGKSDNQYYILGDFMKISAKKFKSDENHREKLIQDYMTASDLIGEIAASTAQKRFSEAQKAKLAEAISKTKENIEAYFINSGAADCDQLEAIYAPKVEENKTNLEFLKKVVNIMTMLKCTESDAYYHASEYAHAISPTATTAAGCGYQYYKKGNIAKAIEYFDEAINLDTCDANKADYNYKAAVILNSDKQYAKAKSYCNKAIALDAHKGAYYILLANIYAASPNWSKDPILNRCTYFLILDKLYLAKRMDESVTEDANKLISAYAGHTPAIEDLFFLGLKKGDALRIEGWINESTTIR